ncbi:unnamed protein product [Urochloa humidicola]
MATTALPPRRLSTESSTRPPDLPRSRSARSPAPSLAPSGLGTAAPVHWPQTMKGGKQAVNQAAAQSKEILALVLSARSSRRSSSISFLREEAFQGKILEGVQVLLSCAHKVLARNRAPPARLLLNQNDDQEQDEEI